MAAINSSVLACNYAISGIELNSKLNSSSPSIATPLLVIRAQHPKLSHSNESSGGRRAALLGLGAAVFTAAISTTTANAGVIDDYLEKSKANKVSYYS